MVTTVSLAAQRSALDELFPKSADKHRVHASNGVLYAAMLNQSAVTSAAAPVKGHNKFYALQVVENNKQTRFWFFKRWGRVGAQTPQSSVEECTSLQAALSLFAKTYAAKTGGNAFGSTDPFKAVEGKYTHLEIDYEAEVAALERGANSDSDEAMTDDSDGASKPPADAMDVDGETASSSASSSSSPVGPTSALPPAVLRLMELIADMSACRRLMAEDFSLDVDRAPLGRLSAAQLSRGMEVLTQIEELLQKKGLGDKTRERLLTTHTSEFYTLVPHAFGMSRPPLIDDLATTAAKARMLQDLGHMGVADGIVRAHVAGTNLHRMDQVYSRLHATLTPLDAAGATFAKLREALVETHAPTHRAQFTSLSLVDAFEVAREGEAARFAPFDALPNHQLLWHGSRLTNAVGILSQGLRVAPPEAPATGYMFGKGVYFADLSSKAANYCHATAGSPYGVLLLCEVATGTPHALKSAKYLARPPSPCHSVKGVGRSEPRPSASAPLDSAALTPVVLHAGPPTPAEGAEGSKLLYNEWVVYEESQIKIRYLLKVKFEGMS